MFNSADLQTKPNLNRSKDYLIASAVSADVLKEDLKVILRAAKILKRDIATSYPWQFHGTFDDYEPPALLKTFCRQAVQCIGRVKSTDREQSVNQSASVLAQHFVGLTDPTDKCRTTP